MRRLLLPLIALLAIAAGPADEAERLMDAGQEREAYELIQRAAAVGDVEAIDYLAWFYDEGRVVARDRSRAAMLYRQAAERGQRHAQWRLGVMLDLGEGVREDPAEAVDWFRRAAAQGSPRGHTSLAVMYANGRGVERDYAQAMRYYREGARLGDAHGFYGVGALYTNGEGVPADAVEGLAWMLVAATLGDHDAERASEHYNLPDPEMEAAVARANALLREFGYSNSEVRYRNLDREREEGRSTPVA